MLGYGAYVNPVGNLDEINKYYTDYFHTPMKIKLGGNEMGIIYSYKNKQNGKRYIGQTINPEQRKKAHISDSTHIDTKFYRAVRKYGWSEFEYEILANSEDREELDKLEVEFIKEFNSIQEGYNIRSGGEHPIMGEETKKKLQKANAFQNAELSEGEIIELRNAYLNYESPSQIYKEKYIDRMHFNSFLNIWTGQRYAYIMPEVFTQRAGRKKYTESVVKEIRRIREEEGLSYDKLSKLFGIPKPTIADIVKYRTWKNV